MRGGGVADLLREETAISGAAGVAIPVEIIRIVVPNEPIRRVAVDVSPRARSVPQKGTRHTQKTTESLLLVLVLVERLLRSAEK